MALLWYLPKMMMILSTRWQSLFKLMLPLVIKNHTLPSFRQCQGISKYERKIASNNLSFQFHNIIMHILWCSKKSFLKSGFHFSWHPCNGLALINQTTIRARKIDILFRHFWFWVLTNSVPSINITCSYIMFDGIHHENWYHNAFQNCFLANRKLNKD